MPRTKTVNQQIREEKAEQIIQAAAKVFARKGTATTMADLALEAGISQGLAYRYFPSKEAIFTVLVKKQTQAGGGIASRLQAIRGTPGERLRLLVTYIIESRRMQPEFYQVFDHILHDERVADDLRKVVAETGGVIRDTLRQLIIDGQASGEVAQDDPDQLLVAILACFDGLMRWKTILAPGDDEGHFPEAGVILRMLEPEKRKG